MKTLGVTGGIGSGKTAVCGLLEARGAEVFYADRVAKGLYEREDVREAVTAAFGAATYDAEGRLDRTYLAGQVFGDAERLAELNAILHPRVRQGLLTSQADAHRRGVPLHVYEAALIYETGGEEVVDAVLVVHASEAARIARVGRRDGAAPEAVRARMQHQLPPDELLRRADYVVRNDGSLEDLEREVERFWRAFVETPTRSSHRDGA